MDNLENINLIAAFVAAFVGAVAVKIVDLIFDSINQWIVKYRKSKRGSEQAVAQPRRTFRSRKWFSFRNVLFIFVFTVAVYIFATNIVRQAGSLPDIEFTISNFVNQSEIPTPIPTGDRVMEINFDQSGDGNCNDYDADRLGYQDQQYYIHPDRDRGYVAICHEMDGLPPEGLIQVTAFPSEASAYFGYGVLFGWKGGGLSTTDACMLGIRKSGSSTKAVFVDWVDGDYKSRTLELKNIELDAKPHTLSVVLMPDGRAQAYLDGVFFAEHVFTQCSTGPIGMVAWSAAHKIFFDDLKYDALVSQ